MYCDYVVYLTKDKKISSVTRHDYAKDLKILLKFLYKKGYIKSDIAYQIEKLPKRKYLIPKIISVDTIRMILNKSDKANVLDIRDNLIIVLCYDCGLRLSELTRLQVNDFDFANGIIRVTGKWNKQRNVPLTFTVKSYYKLYLQMTRNRKRGSLFLTRDGLPAGRDCIIDIFKRIKKKYNLQDFHPHLLRHSFATIFLLNGGDSLVLQQILGHTTLEMTKKYVHIANSIDISKNNIYSPLSVIADRTKKAYQK